MGHEVTHSFDDQASQIDKWSKESREKYIKKVKCIIDQYSKQRVPEIEVYLKELTNQHKPFYLRGDFTKNEDIA